MTTYNVILYYSRFKENGKGTRFPVLGSEDYLNYGHDYVIKGNDSACTGKFRVYPVGMTRLINMISPIIED